MPLNSQMLLRKYNPALEKTAARAGMKLIQSLVNSGRLADAEALAARLWRAGGLKVTPQGSQLRFLGSGVEGPAHMVIGAKDAPARVLARKTFDPGGPIFSKQQLADKFNHWRRLNAEAALTGHPQSIGHPMWSKLVSKRLGKTQGGGRFMLSEYIPGETLGRSSLAHNRNVHREMMRAVERGDTRRSYIGDVISSDYIPSRSATGGRYNVGGWPIPRHPGKHNYFPHPSNTIVDNLGNPRPIDFYLAPQGAADMPRLSTRAAELLESVRPRGPWAGAQRQDLTDGRKLHIMRQLGRRRQAAGWRNRIPGAQTSVEQVRPSGVPVPANVERALQTLGPGSRRAGGRFPRAARAGSGQPVATGTIPDMAADVARRNANIMRRVTAREPRMTAMEVLRPGTEPFGIPGYSGTVPGRLGLLPTERAARYLPANIPYPMRAAPTQRGGFTR